MTPEDLYELDPHKEPYMYKYCINGVWFYTETKLAIPENTRLAFKGGRLAEAPSVDEVLANVSEGKLDSSYEQEIEGITANDEPLYRYVSNGVTFYLLEPGVFIDKMFRVYNSERFDAEQMAKLRRYYNQFVDEGKIKGSKIEVLNSVKDSV